MNCFSTTEKNNMLTDFATRSLFTSLHSDFPGDSGASEITGGTPPYVRQPVTWGAAAAGALDNATNPTFNVPAGTTVKWLGFWSLVAAGVFLGSVPIGSVAPVPFEVDDAVQNDVFRAAAHGFVNGNQVVLFDTDVAVLPTGVTEGQTYFVVGATTNTFQLSLTSGGAAISLTSNGAGFAGLITPETFGSQGTYTTTNIHVALSR